jgi:type II secretory pathway component PulF
MMEKVNEYIMMEIDESISRFVKWLPDITYLFVGIALIAFVIVVMVPLMNVYMGSFITY